MGRSDDCPHQRRGLWPCLDEGTYSLCQAAEGLEARAKWLQEVTHRVDRPATAELRAAQAAADQSGLASLPNPAAVLMTADGQRSCAGIPKNFRRTQSVLGGFFATATMAEQNRSD
jgi:hypothetical protein